MTKQDYKELENIKREVETQIKALEQGTGELYQKLGREYYKIMGDTYDSSLQTLVEDLKKQEEKAAKLCSTMRDIEERMKEPVDNICPKCGKVMESGAKFCSECGFRLTDEVHVEAIVPMEPTCKSCGNILKQGSRFCGKCGTMV